MVLASKLRMEDLWKEDERFMREAIKESMKALERDEVPVGAIVVCNGQIIARGHNLTETLNDPTAHAEMQAVTAAASFLNGKYLTQCTLYVTLEPCPMCAGALHWAQLGRLVFGASDAKRGYTLYTENLLHPKTLVRKNVLPDVSKETLTAFFRSKR